MIFRRGYRTNGMNVDTPITALSHPRLAAIPAFMDNYIWALCDASGSQCLVVDPGDPVAVTHWLQQHNVTLRAILVTHHHLDHIGGVAALRAPGVPVFGPRHEAIHHIDYPVGDGDRVLLPELDIALEVFDVPGHTAGHIAFHGQIDRQPLLFCGDTLFSAGCGRLFEGRPEEMHASLQRLACLPATTLVCCAHEYTLGNLRFAAAVEPDNPTIAAVTAWARGRRTAGLPTLPSNLARELGINPFLRTGCRAVIAAAERYAEQPLADATATFAALRRWKDGFH